MRIYIAGPYNPYGRTPHDSIRVAQQNVDRAIDVANQIMDTTDHYCFVPHLSHYIHQRAKEDRGYWYMDYDFTFLEHWAEALFVIEESPGVLKEIELAEKLGFPVFRTIEDLWSYPYEELK